MLVASRHSWAARKLGPPSAHLGLLLDVVVERLRASGAEFGQVSTGTMMMLAHAHLQRRRK